jgi:hypothetical protein
MTSQLATEYIAKRMCELGHGSHYSIRLRHLVLQPSEKREITEQNLLMILIEPYCDVRVESGSGIFDLSEDLANELQYEHSGVLKITNHSFFINHIRFIQVIPKHCKKPCR